MVPRHIDRKNIHILQNIHTNFRALYLGTELRIHVSKCFPKIYYSCINRNTLGYKEYLFFLGWIRNRTNIPINPSDHNYIHTNILFIILFTYIVYNFAAHRFDLICTKFSRFCTLITKFNSEFYTKFSKCIADRSLSLSTTRYRYYSCTSVTTV